MSLLPMLFSSWWEGLDRPHRLFDQHFGLSLSPEDLPTALPFPDNEIVVIKPRRRGTQRYQPYERALERASRGGISTVQADKNKFQVTLDVQQFAPEEVSVKVVGKNVIVEGKHEEKQDEHGWISRQFVRKYLVPDQCDIDQLKSSLSSDGVLTITAPRKEPEPQSKNERIIQIENTGQPALRQETASAPAEKQKETPQKNTAQQRGQEKTVKAA
ncbi:protein lethal(2)essential for life-like [Ceratina calcarata]|uniref:Protein lethal(2)essential for life-like n=1 Tax=Ceratina calcarata TaxID=156304 RepID=A0AAJ7JCK2_9HYME|nr:protein lethal(2)essential for life-like [Ceratina calcarata]XP_017889879.1 protein lethal(2)essential for life-like [Ceratina calcarata]